MNKTAKLYIAGHTGLFGNALYEAAKKKGYKNVVVRKHDELDLTRQEQVEVFFKSERPDYVIMAAALVGGIDANRRYMADFCMENLLMTCNVMNASHKYRVKKLLYLGSSCIYPRKCIQPILEDSILTGSCEPTNEGYAIAKIAGIRLCEYYQKQYGDCFISCIPANVYGLHDCFDLEKAHVIPALIMKFHEAKMKNAPEVTIWGTGRAEREFLFIDDAAEACLKLFEYCNESQPVNIGIGHTNTIQELSEIIRDTVGYTGEIKYDDAKPDGMPKRLLDSEKAKKYCIYPKTSLEEGIRHTYNWYLANIYEEQGNGHE